MRLGSTTSKVGFDGPVGWGEGMKRGYREGRDGAQGN